MDIITTSIAFLLFNIFRYHFFNIAETNHLSLLQYLLMPKLLGEQILIPVFLPGIVYWMSGYYNKPLGKSRLQELIVTLNSAVVSVFTIYLLMLVNDSTGARRREYEIIITLLVLLFSLLYLGRWILTSLTVYHLRHKKWKYYTLIVGNSEKSREIYRKLMESGSVWSYDVVGFIRIKGEHQICDNLASWNWEEIGNICKSHRIDQIILAPENNSDEVIMRTLNHLYQYHVPVKIAPDTLSYIISDIRQSDIMGVPLLDLTSPRISEFQKNLKRTIDVVMSVFGLIVLSPLLAVVAVIIKATSPGSIIYRQERIGLGHQPFTIYKFRSMREDAEKHGPSLSSANDSRITAFGRIMRKYRIDELPQLWNVLRGNMSMVGPRPERQYYIEQIIKLAPYYVLLFQIRPGVTSWGMVKYGYATDVRQMVRRSRYDLIYINNMSIATDLKIMIYTVNTVLKGIGM
ncbi:MAG: sugar transferase [Candidatus Amulumruptor caecigallinarius]|nr:sugar transferase [Candidatus Amulumruptor caecigallinarius]